ncbi:MAG: Gfo/Idh/MocA family oxidoreductase [Gemmatimonadetes bacterium]|nr:Gfo/Idh/MocA family oxidoreductase [Gemmatimonadota bacterium]
MAARSITRRDFVGDMARAAVAFTIVPRHVLGRGYRAPSDLLRIACIGVGGRGRDNVKGVSGEVLYALCDVDLNRAEEMFRSYPKAKRYRDFRELLEREEDHIDAVVISTPDHTHAAAASLAMKMRKHVYCEKPLARTLGEVRALVEGARRYKVATQMGNQGHAGAGTRQLREYVEAGAIGTVREIHYWTNRPIWPQALERPLEAYNVPPYLDWDLWLGPAPVRPYAPAYAPFRWRGWWDFGTGALGDIAPHAMDAAFWTLGLRYPSRIEVETTKLFPETAPRISRLTFEFPERSGRSAVRLVWRDGELMPPRPAGLPPEQAWPYSDVGSQVWTGSDGALIADAYGDKLLLLNEARDKELKANPPPEKYPRSPGVYAEWIAACKGGAPAGSSFPDHAGPLTELVLLGTIAVRMGQTLELDPVTGRVTNVAVPEEYVRPVFREGWRLYT